VDVHFDDAVRFFFDSVRIDSGRRHPRQDAIPIRAQVEPELLQSSGLLLFSF
jgi:hypothetical protein